MRRLLHSIRRDIQAASDAGEGMRFADRTPPDPPWPRDPRLPAHRRVDVQVRYADHRTELLEHEEADAVVDQASPVEAPHEIAP